MVCSSLPSSMAVPATLSCPAQRTTSVSPHCNPRRHWKHSAGRARKQILRRDVLRCDAADAHLSIIVKCHLDAGHRRECLEEFDYLCGNHPSEPQQLLPFLSSSTLNCVFSWHTATQLTCGTNLRYRAGPGGSCGGYGDSCNVSDRVGAVYAGHLDPGEAVQHHRALLALVDLNLAQVRPVPSGVRVQEEHAHAGQGVAPYDEVIVEPERYLISTVLHRSRSPNKLVSPG